MAAGLCRRRVPGAVRDDRHRRDGAVLPLFAQGCGVSNLVHSRPPRLGVALVMIAAIVMLTPMLWVLILSFKDNAALMVDTSSAFTPSWTLANFRNIVGEGQMFTCLGNILVVSLAMTAGVLLLSSLAGCGLAGLEFPGLRLVLFIV